MQVSINKKIKIPTSTELIRAIGKDTEKLPVRLSENALTVLKARYLKKDDRGAVTEEPCDMFRRVVQVVSGAEDLFGNGAVRNPILQHDGNRGIHAEFAHSHERRT